MTVFLSKISQHLLGFRLAGDILSFPHCQTHVLSRAFENICPSVNLMEKNLFFLVVYLSSDVTCTSSCGVKSNLSFDVKYPLSSDVTCTSSCGI